MERTEATPQLAHIAETKELSSSGRASFPGLCVVCRGKSRGVPMKGRGKRSESRMQASARVTSLLAELSEIPNMEKFKKSALKLLYSVRSETKDACLDYLDNMKAAQDARMAIDLSTSQLGKLTISENFVHPQAG